MICLLLKEAVNFKRHFSRHLEDVVVVCVLQSFLLLEQSHIPQLLLEEDARQS